MQKHASKPIPVSQNGTSKRTKFFRGECTGGKRRKVFSLSESLKKLPKLSLSQGVDFRNYRTFVTNTNDLSPEQPCESTRNCFGSNNAMFVKKKKQYSILSDECFKKKSKTFQKNNKKCDGFHYVVKKKKRRKILEVGRENTQNSKFQLLFITVYAQKCFFFFTKTNI